MSLLLRFLGTSASRPTVERNVSSLAVIREGETLMFDCGEGTQRHGYSIIPFAVEHGDRIAIGYHIAEETRLGRFNPEKAREIGIPEGPLWGKIHKGETVQLPDGRTITPAELVGPSRSGRRVVLTG